MTEREERDLLEWYKPWLRTVAARMCRSKPSRVDDLVQEGWIAIWRATKTWDSRSPLDWWLKRKAVGVMLDKIRNEESKKNTLFNYVPDINDVVTVAFVLDNVELAYHHGEIMRALNTLTPRQREYVVMRFWGGQGYPDLCEHFGYPPQALWTASRKKLADELAHLK